MSVIAKFYVSSVTPAENSPNTQIQMHPVCRGVENASWSAATPSGTIMMNVLNEGASGQFKVGQEYYVTFEKAIPPSVGDGHKAEPVTDKYGHALCKTCGMFLGDDEPHRTEAKKLHDERYGTEGA